MRDSKQEYPSKHQSTLPFLEKKFINMTKEEYIQTMKEHYHHNWIHLMFAHTVCPSSEMEGWELKKKDDNDDTEARLQYLEGLVVKMREEIADLKESIRPYLLPPVLGETT